METHTFSPTSLPLHTIRITRSPSSPPACHVDVDIATTTASSAGQYAPVFALTANSETATVEKRAPFGGTDAKAASTTSSGARCAE
jgi:hypothetical protein